MDAFDAIRNRKRVTDALLRVIVEAASDPHRPCYEIATDFLDKLTRNYGPAREAVEKMATDPRQHVRFNAILCIAESAPRPFQLRLLRQGLRDKSSRVRWKAADWAGRLRLADLVPELEDAFAAEKNSRARSTIEFNLRLLRDGYILVPELDGSVEVTTFCKNGIVSGWFQEREIRKRGIRAIVARLASKAIS
jgi:hypothetical protein